MDPSEKWKKLFVLKQKKEKQTIKNHSNELEKNDCFYWANEISKKKTLENASFFFNKLQLNPK